MGEAHGEALGGIRERSSQCTVVNLGNGDVDAEGGIAVVRGVVDGSVGSGVREARIEMSITVMDPLFVEGVLEDPPTTTTVLTGGDPRVEQ